MSDRIDELGERARWFLEQFDEIDLAGICASEETAKLKAQAAISRVRRLCELTIAASVRVQAIDQARDTLAALDESTDAPVDIPADKNGPTIANAQVDGGEVVDNEEDTASPYLPRIRQAWLNADDAADRFAANGMDSDRLRRIIEGHQRPTSLDLALIADACRTTVDWLLGGRAPRDMTIRAEQSEPPLRTTPDNSPTSSDTTDNPLREQYAAAIHADAERPRDERVGIINAVLAVRDRELEQLRAKVAEFDHIINWHTTCASCARILDSAYQETVRAEKAEQQRDRLAGVLSEVLAAFVRKVDGYRIPRRSAEADVVTLEKWRSILADNQEQP